MKHLAKNINVAFGSSFTPRFALLASPQARAKAAIWVRLGIGNAVQQGLYLVKKRHLLKRKNLIKNCDFVSELATLLELSLETV